MVDDHTEDPRVIKLCWLNGLSHDDGGTPAFSAEDPRMVEISWLSWLSHDGHAKK